MRSGIFKIVGLFVIVIFEVSFIAELKAQVETNSSSIYLGDDPPELGNDEARIQFDGLDLHLINMSAIRYFGVPIEKGKNIYDSYSHIFKVDDREVGEVIGSGLKVTENKVTRTQSGASDLLAFAYGNISGTASAGQIIDGTTNFTVSELKEVSSRGRIEIAFDRDLVLVEDLVFTVTSKIIGHNVSISKSHQTNLLVVNIENYLGRSNGAAVLPEAVDLNFIAYKVR